MKTVAVVPVYNENPDKVASVLNELKKFVDEIIVVDDGSNQKIKKAKKQESNIIYLRHQINRGQGAALQTGTDYAIRQGAEIIIHFDSDGQHNPQDIPELIKPIQDGKADFVFGSRFLAHTNADLTQTYADNKMPWTKKHILFPIARIISWIFTGLELTDAHNGLRAFSASVAPQIYLSQDRMAHVTEYCSLVKKNNVRYTERPVHVVYNEYGQGVGGGFKVLKELITGKIIR